DLASGSGAFVLLPADPAVPGSGGIAGVLSAHVAVSGGGASANLSVGLRLNKSKLPVNETLTLGGQTFAIQFPTGADVFAISGSGNLAIGDPPFVTIEGNVSFSGDDFSGD